MKKIFAASVLALTLLALPTEVFAASRVAEMATTKGGRQVAECAQKMDRGVSVCARMVECPKEM